METSSGKAALIVFGSKVYLLLVGVLFIPVLVRLLGPTRYGHLAIVLSVYGLLRIAMRYGTTEASRKYISERSDPEWQAGVIRFVFTYATAIGLLTAAVFVLGAWSGIVAQLFGREFTSLFYLLGIFTLARQYRLHVVWTLMGLKQETWSEPLRIVEKTLYVGGTVVLVLAGFGVAGVLIADIISSLVVALVGSFGITRSVPWKAICRRSSIELPRRQMLIYSLSSIGFFLFLTSLYHVDVLLLQLWVPDDEVGFYRAALAIAEVLWVAPLAVQLVILQRVSHHWNEGNLEAIQHQATVSTRYVFLFTMLLTVVMATLADAFVPFYLGPSFEPTVIPLLLLLPGVLGFAIARPTLAINQGRRSLRPLILATAGCSGINLILNLLLIPPFGIVGAAIATSIGYGSLVFFQALAARHLGYRPFSGLRYGQTVLTAVVTALVIVPLSRWFVDPIVLLTVIPPLGAVVYLVAAMMTGALRQDDLERILDTIPEVPINIEHWAFVLFNQLPKIYR